MRILLVKTSSLGDVIHNLPVVTDLRTHFPDAAIDWVVEEVFAEIPRLHPGVLRVLPVALRRWRKSLLATATWREMATFRATLQGESYDLVIDTQGLLKSALITRMAKGKRCGYTAAAAREPLAARFYDARFDVAKELHAVQRNRQLAALAAGYAAAPAPDYGIAVISTAGFAQPAGCAGAEQCSANSPLRPTPSHQGIPLCITFAGPTAMLLTATSRDDKLWPEERWIEVGQALHGRGLRSLLPAGSATERERAARIALAIPGAIALPSMRLAELAAQLAAARIVIGVDTGLVHLAAALGRPVLALFSASNPALTGVLASTPAINLGRRGQSPSVGDVLAAALPLL